MISCKVPTVSVDYASLCAVACSDACSMHSLSNRQAGCYFTTPHGKVSRSTHLAMLLQGGGGGERGVCECRTRYLSLTIPMFYLSCLQVIAVLANKQWQDEDIRVSFL